MRGLATRLRDADWNITVNVAMSGQKEITAMTGAGPTRHITRSLSTSGRQPLLPNSSPATVVKEADHPASSSDYNRQISFGEDVISRIMSQEARRA
jgi:hypothetical protein